MSLSRNAHPLFIVLEGIDGSGSTTQGDRLTSWLISKGYKAHFTHEPTNGPAGMPIQLALSRRLTGRSPQYHDPSSSPPSTTTQLDPHCLALLFAADRMDHLATEIIPSLEQGRIVICDRYIVSTLAYQGLSVDEDWLVSINCFARRPDLTIYLDVSVEQARYRMRRTRWTRDLYEDEAELRLIRDRYLSVLQRRAQDIGPSVTIDASQPTERVGQVIRRVVTELLPASPTDKPSDVMNLFRDSN